VIRTTDSSKKLRKTLGAMAIVAASTMLAILLCELGSRLVLNPVDFLSPRLERDDILGARLPGGSGGHDAWGFRNRRVPETADVVALGDSHTYGNRATMEDAWPSVLGRLTGKSVYNLGMGGYGPNQYDYLLQTKALGLKPRVVICGLYMGDDFDNAFRITYGLSHWSSLRREDFGPVDPDVWEREVSADTQWHQKARQWLSQHSILYRLVIHGVLQPIKGRYQIENASRLYESTTSLVLHEKHVEEAFVPTATLRGLDQESPTVREGMRLTFQLLLEMNALCAQHGVQFIVAVIPTKEMVYSRYLEHNPALGMSAILDRVIASEQSARQKLFARLDEMNVRYVDTLPALERASETERIYIESGVDMHPNRNGYRVIAEALSQVLQSSR
jgi:lysophospholipase L1-like esterase